MEGDIDLALVPELQSELETAVEAGLVNVVIDLSRVVYVDSSALGLLVWLDHQLVGTGGKVVLAGADENVSRILEVSGLLSVAASVKTQGNVEEALKGLDVVVAPGSPMWAEVMSMPSDVGYLAGVRERASVLVSTLGFADAALFDIKVALGEALANAVRHGSPGDGSTTILASIRAFEDRVEIDVIDSGAGFDGAHSGTDDLYASGGRGVMFMRALMDDVHFTSVPEGGTVVTLVKRRP